MQATAIYRSIIAEIERRRIQLGWTMLELDNAAGYHSGYWAKMVHVDQPSGRQARWEMLEYAMGALFPDGYRVAIEPSDGALMSALSMRFHIRAAAPPGTLSFREHMRELAKKSVPARMEKTTPEQRSEVGRKAAAARWGKRRMDAEGSVDE